MIALHDAEHWGAGWLLLWICKVDVKTELAVGCVVMNTGHLKLIRGGNAVVEINNGGVKRQRESGPVFQQAREIVDAAAEGGAVRSRRINHAGEDGGINGCVLWIIPGTIAAGTFCVTPVR